MDKCLNVKVLSFSWLQTVRPSISSSTQSLHEKIVTRGGDVTLQCEADGLPRPAISWLKDGRPLTGRRAQTLNEGRLLRIRGAQVADTGRYTCIAVNVAGQADSKYDVNVHGERNRERSVIVVIMISFISLFKVR